MLNQDDSASQERLDAVAREMTSEERGQGKLAKQAHESLGALGRSTSGLFAV